MQVFQDTYALHADYFVFHFDLGFHRGTVNQRRTTLGKPHRNTVSTLGNCQGNARVGYRTDTQRTANRLWSRQECIQVYPHCVCLHRATYRFGKPLHGRFAVSCHPADDGHRACPHASVR